MKSTARPPPMQPRRVLVMARATTEPSPSEEIRPCEPPLNAKKPKMRMKAPRLMKGTEWPGSGLLWDSDLKILLILFNKILHWVRISRAWVQALWPQLGHRCLRQDEQLQNQQNHKMHLIGAGFFLLFFSFDYLRVIKPARRGPCPVRLDGVDDASDDHRKQDVTAGRDCQKSREILKKTYPLKLPLSAMAPDTMVAQVAAKVHWNFVENTSEIFFK